VVLVRRFAGLEFALAFEFGAGLGVLGDKEHGIIRG
jgi:hypothetical protein